MLIDEYDGDCNKKCLFCGEARADAIWQGKKADVHVCKRCAVVCLPQLMADAIVGGTSKQMFQDSNGGTSELTKDNLIFKNFHSAFSSALIRKFKSAK